MAAAESFDITTGCDLQEVSNAVQQALKEIGQRYDFRGLDVKLEFLREEAKLVLAAPDQFKLDAMMEVLQTKLVRRKVPVKNLKPGPVQPAASSTVRQEVLLQQGIPTDTARSIVKFIKDHKLKKVQAAIQGDQVRVSAPSRNALQEAIALLKQEDFGMELSFGNYRSG